MRHPTYIMIHHTAVSRELNSDQFIANNNYHHSRWNFRSSLGFYLGYNYEISANGRTRKAREEGESTASCYQQNMNDGRCVHIALDGNFEIENPTEKQIKSLTTLLKQVTTQQGIGVNNILFHNQYAATACPGKNINLSFVKSLITSKVIEDNKENIKQKIRDLLDEVEDLVQRL